MVQAAGAALLQLMVAPGFGSSELSEVSHHARSNAARFGAGHTGPEAALPTQLCGSAGKAARSAVAIAPIAASLDTIVGGAGEGLEVTPIEVGGVLAQYSRLECIAEARLAASSAASDLSRAVLVLESESACSLAMPSRPTQITTMATMTSTRLKPQFSVAPRRALMCSSRQGR